MKNMSESHHPLVTLARQAIESFLADKPLPGIVDMPGFDRAAGTFVSIKKKGQLRGCIGTIEPIYATLVEEVINNAVSAATRDPRFPSITEDELGEITISVDVLTPTEPVSSLEELDPDRFGIVVKSGVRKGVLLPDLPGVDTAKQQVEIAMNKAGISRPEDVQLFRFEVKRYY
jgi:AmmeMemoRadiSam system protein A